MSIDVIARNYAIDLLRSIGIGCMILNHVGNTPLSHIISSFHMPLFFFVSGLFFTRNKPFDSFTKNKAKRILIPYLSFAIFYYLIWLLIDTSHSPWYDPLKYLLWDNSVGAGNGMPYVGALWFLTAFFIANITYFGISYIKNARLQLIAVIFTVLLGTAIPLVLSHRFPYTMDSALVGVGFLYCGHQLQNSIFYEKLSHLPILMLAGLVAGLLFLISLNAPVNMRLGTYGNILLFWINALGCIIIGINMCNRIANRKENFSLPISWIYIMGKDSLVFLCVNEFVIIALRHIIPVQNKIINYPLIFLLTILICYVINWFIQHTKLRWFIGKF